MKHIKLTRGFETTVDDSDFAMLSRWKWHYLFNKRKGYAARREWSGLHPKYIYMHEQIMNPPAGMEVDHKDNDGLNNQRYNLRVCTRSQNLMNASKRPGMSSEYKGVSWDKSRNVWRAYITVDCKYVHLGRFHTAEDAAHAYDAAAKKYFGEFAKLNEPEEG